MKTLGVDLAAATKKTAAAVIEWGSGTARLAHLALDVDDDEIVRLFGASDMTGIDCPVGWPDAFLPFLAGHLAVRAAPRAGLRRHRGPPAAGLPGHRPLRHRPDRADPAQRLRRPAGPPGDALRRHPGQDRRGPRAAGQGRQRPAGRGLPGGVAEVLGPAGPRLQGPRRRGSASGWASSWTACRRRRRGWTWPDTRTGWPARTTCSTRSSPRSPPGPWPSARRSAPTPAHARAARTEGWIHLPTGGLAGLTGSRP